MDINMHLKEDSKLSNEAVLRLLQELKELRQMVESLQKKRAVLLAAAAANTHPRFEEDENDREMEVSPSDSLTPQPAQAEPYTSVEEVVVPDFKEVRGKYRKRRTSPSALQGQTAISGGTQEAQTRQSSARNAAKWASVSSAMTTRQIKFSKAKTCIDGIRVNTVTVDDFRALTCLLVERKMPYHSFALPEQKTPRAVLRTVPCEIDIDDLQTDLEEQGLAPVKVTGMTSSRSKKPLPLVLVEVPKDKAAIFDLKACVTCRSRSSGPTKRRPQVNATAVNGFTIHSDTVTHSRSA
jgi:hypothetical protein